MTKINVLGQERFCFQGGMWNQLCSPAVLLHWHSTHKAKVVIQRSDARIQRMTSFFFTSTCSVCRGGKKLLCQDRYQKNCCRDQLLSQETSIKHSTFSNSFWSWNFLLSVVILIVYFTLDFVHSAYNFGNIYTWINPFSQEKSNKFLMSRFCLCKTSIHMGSSIFSIIYSSSVWYVYLI